MDEYAHGCSHVDHSAHAAAYVQCLRLMLSLDYFQHYKRTSYQRLRLQPGDRVLEVGCGTGDDAVALAALVGEAGRVVAVDKSETMIKQARAQAASSGPVEFVVGDVQALPFDEASFDAARVDRTLQHVPRPGTALAEMTRVVRSGGYVTAFDPDWESLIVDADDPGLTRRLLNHWCDSFRCGWIGRRLYRYVVQAGLADVHVEPFPLVFTRFDLANEVFHLTGLARRAHENGVVSATEADAWLDTLKQRHADGHFFAAFTAYLVTGRKP